ncbi:MAG TPA: carboxypeptidase regulatory-like domain-containing protein [Acidobacteriaceae bacterium]
MQMGQWVRRSGMILGSVLLCLTGLVQAQEFRGTISGAVTDPSGAAVPGAQVVVREVHTGTVSRTKSDAAGQYVVPFLLPGDYSITATAPGFQTTTRNGVTLQSQEHPIVDVKMAVGNTSETVEVTANAPLLDQANASVGQVISTESVADLPLNGRTPTTLAELSVGVITTAAPQLVHPFDNNAGNSWSMGGTPNQVSEVLLDGSPDLTLLGALAYAPTEDSVQEVSVRPFDTDASFGHTIGGVINQVTKSGTNRLHGSVYEFSQISNLDANTYFNKRANPVPKLPVTHYNQYGMSVGGPIWIPKVVNGKDKLFFFFAFEGLKDSQPATTTLTVPTAAELAGDFSQTLAAGCPTGLANDPTTAAALCNPDPAIKQNTEYADPNQLYNPFTATLVSNSVVRQPILNNQLSTLAHPTDLVAGAYLKLFPAPNNTAGGPDGSDNYISNAPSIDTYNNEFGRLDYNLSSRDHVFFDMRHNIRAQTKNDYFGNGITGTVLDRENFGATLDNVFTLNSTTIFDTRLNWTSFNEVHGTPGSKYTPTSLGFPSGIGAASLLPQLPFINFGTGGSCGSHTSYQCLGDTGSALDPTTSYQAFADMVKVLGRHTLKIGFDGRQYRLSVQNYGASAGTYTFNSSFMNAGSGGNSNIFGGDLAAFEYGLASSGSFDLAARSDYHQYYVGTFVQDDWRVNDRFTVNLGLRFDIDTPFEEKAGRTVNGFNPTAVNAASAAAAAAFKPTTVSSGGVTATVSSLNTLGGLTFPSAHNGAVFKTNSGFFSPRIGFSFSPTDKWVFRGGFGIFVQPETLSNLAATGTYSSSAISNSEGFSQTTTYLATTDNFVTPANTLSNPFPNGFVQPAGSSAGASTFLGTSISFLAPVQHDPYSERWDIGAQRSLTNSTMLEVLYVGNHSLHLPISAQNLNAPTLQYLTTAPFRNQALSSAYGTSVPNPYAKLLPNGGSANNSKVAFSNLIYPYPQFGTAAVTEQNQTIGQSYFNSAIIHIEQRKKHGLTLTANYSFSKLIEADTFLNDQDTMPTRRISPFDHTHHFTAGATYELPFGRGKMFSFGGSRVMDEIAGGWVINGIYQFQTGAPFEFSADIPLQPGVNVRQIASKRRDTSPVGSGTPALTTNLFVTGNNTSCPKDSNGKTTICDLSGQTFFNGQYTDHYRTLPQTLSWVRTDGFNNLDASILKNFNFTEGAYLQLRFETFNTLNHAVFAAPNVSSATSSNFGYITGTFANSLPRQVQLGARIVF